MTESKPPGKKNLLILPRKWDVLNLPDKSVKYLFGFHYLKGELAYTVYITDLTRVWMADARYEQIKWKGAQHGIPEQALPNVYGIIAQTFEENFSSDDIKTTVELEKRLIDENHPLQLTLKISKLYKEGPLNWSLDLVRLPETSSISILRNVIFHLSTIVCSLNEYRKDLSERIEQKDSAIRFLSETVEGTGEIEKIRRWAPERSHNALVLKSFDPYEFDKSWKAEKFAKLQGQNIWDVLKANSDSNTWSLGTSFTEPSPSRTSSNSGSESPISRKRQLDGNSKDNEFEMTPDFSMKRIKSPPKRKKTEIIAELAEDFKEYDLKREEQSVKVEEDPIEPEPRAKTTASTPDPVDHGLQSSPPQSSQVPAAAPQKSTQGSERRKRDFGQSRKRRINQTKFSPIKSAKYFQSDD